jgi:hypothetical protein
VSIALQAGAHVLQMKRSSGPKMLLPLQAAAAQRHAPHCHSPACHPLRETAPTCVEQQARAQGRWLRQLPRGRQVRRVMWAPCRLAATVHMAAGHPWPCRALLLLLLLLLLQPGRRRSHSCPPPPLKVLPSSLLNAASTMVA